MASTVVTVDEAEQTLRFSILQYLGTRKDSGKCEPEALSVAVQCLEDTFQLNARLEAV